MREIKLRIALSSLLFILSCQSIVFGDGCYIPERAVRKIPEISAQRAILSWKEGTETLVISSALDSESQKLGWIIPLPAVPDVIEKQSPGALKTLNFCLQPKITHDLHHEWVAVLLAVLLGNLILGTALFKRERLIDLLLLLLVMFILSSLMLPAVGASGSAAARTSKLRVEKSVSVGSYEINILKASKLADLNAWLAENGFSALPSSADNIIAEYLSKGWVFAAIKLARDESGANAPHPIRMRFASKEPVYPLKLTSIAGGSPQFEIFVIANQKAACDTIPEEFCDRFSMTKNERNWENETEKLFVTEYESKTTFTGVNSKLTISHPAVQQFMWDNCVLTKFAGTIAAENMSKDLNFKWVPFKACRQHIYTSRGAKETAFIYFFGAAGIWVFISMIVFRKRILTLFGPLRYFGAVVVPGCVVLLFVVVVAFAMMPKLSDSEVGVSRGRHHNPPYFYFGVTDFLEEHPTLLQGTEREIRDTILKNWDKNEATGAKLEEEDSPGNFTIIREDNQNVIRIYGYDGSVMAIRPKKPDKREKSEANR
jgi:hypothetical protein